MKTSSWIKFILLIAVLLVILNLPVFSGKTRNFFYSISAPFQKYLWNAGAKTSDFFETIADIGNLKKQNEQMKLQSQQLLAQSAIISELQQENKTLRDALKIGLQKDFSTVLGDITAKDASQDSILVNKGSKDGVIISSAVITEQKILVGKVEEVYDNFSRITLISNPKSVFNVEIVKNTENPEENILGITKGEGNFHLLLDKIPKDKEVKQGDIVTTSSLGDLAKGLVIGQIQDIRKSDVEAFQQAEIKPSFDITELETVFIIR